MRPIIAKLQKVPLFGLTIFAPQAAMVIRLRNYTFAVIAWTGIVEFIGKYLGAAFASVESSPLPDYEWH